MFCLLRNQNWKKGMIGFNRDEVVRLFLCGLYRWRELCE